MTYQLGRRQSTFKALLARICCLLFLKAASVQETMTQLLVQHPTQATAPLVSHDPLKSMCCAAPIENLTSGMHDSLPMSKLIYKALD